MSVLRVAFAHLQSRRCQVLCVGGFFGLLLLLGLWLHRDYGVSADEPNNHLNGLVQVKYVAQLFFPKVVEQQQSAAQIPDIRQFKDSDHGVAFEVPLALLSFFFTHNDSRAFYFMRHLCNFFVFVVGVYALYTLARWYLADWRYGLLAAALLVVSPRLFAEAFYNSKDIVFMACFVISMTTLLYAWQQPTTGRILLHALATALAVNVRVQGLLIILFSLPLLLFRTTKPTDKSSVIKTCSVYLGASIVLIIAGWPYLWSLSWTELWHASDKINHYPWNGSVLYLGHVFQVPFEGLPWHYIPVWIFVTTPVTYSLSACIGLGYVFFSLATSRHRALQQCVDLLVIAWLFIPLLIVITLHPVIYNGWRHLYFVYPAVVLLAVRGLALLFRTIKSAHLFRRQLAVLYLLVVSSEIGYTIWRMVQAHPYEYVYFSFLPPHKAEQLFELDYWGLSYRRGLEWILQHDTDETITFCGNAGYLDNNMLVLPPAQRARLRFVPNPNNAAVPSAHARYFLTAYYYYGGQQSSYPDSLGKEVYTLRADGLRIFSVFRR